MKLLLPLMVVTTMLFGEGLSGKWVLDTMGSNRDVVIRHQQNRMELYRTITHMMEGEPYTVHHMIRGSMRLKANKTTSLKLYVREDGEKTFEYLRTIPLTYINQNRMALDDTGLKRAHPVKKSVAITVTPKKEVLEKQDSKEDDKIEIVIVKKSKPKTSPEKKSDFDPLMMMPGLGDGGAKTVKISKGLTGDHARRFNRGVALKERGQYGKAARILEALYRENASIRGIAIVPHLAEIYQKMGKNSKVNHYCGIVKRYDPYLKCGGKK